MGRWQGPEGTYLDLRRSSRSHEYDLVIAHLDGPKNYEAWAIKDGIQFERDGILHVIRAGDGRATGIKWFADKQNCLVIKFGEGFCRN